MKITTRQIVIAAALSAVAILLGATRLGFIPFVLGIAITIMHVPVIIGAVLEGPVVGTVIGFLFGLFSLIWAYVAPTGGGDVFFQNPLISIVPRLFIGVLAYLAYRALREPRPWKVYVALFGILTVAAVALIVTYSTSLLPNYAAAQAAGLRGQAQALDNLRQIVPALKNSPLGQIASVLPIAQLEQQAFLLRQQADIVESSATWQNWQVIVLVAVLLLLLILGIGVYLALRRRVFERWQEVLAIGVAAVVGTLTNTVLVLTALGLLTPLPPALLVAVGLTNGIPEIVAAVVITVAVVAAWKQIEFGVRGARILREG